MSEPSVIGNILWGITHPVNVLQKAADFIVSSSPNPMISGKNENVQTAEGRVDDAKDTYTQASKTVSDLYKQGYTLSDPILQNAVKARDAAKSELNKASTALQRAKDVASGVAAARTKQAQQAAAKASYLQEQAGGTTATPTLSNSAISSYKYNLPPVKTTYFAEGNTSPSSTPTYTLSSDPRRQDIEASRAINATSGGSPQRQSAGKSISPQPYKSAANAWSSSGRGRGAIQMSRDQLQFKSASGKKVDNTPYGFRFMYNPSSVNMTWGIPEVGVNWEFIASGRDKSSAGALGLMKSSISFSILLNRVEDFGYIAGPDGRLISADPYSGGSSLQERAEIYKKGTMYDMEYLFKVLTFPAGNYSSLVGGFKTNDVGWINPQPVELHLGDGLRYKVRIESLAINHAMFNDRMVPTLSTVDITCTRYYDGMYSDWQTAK